MQGPIGEAPVEGKRVVVMADTPLAMASATATLNDARIPLRILEVLLQIVGDNSCGCGVDLLDTLSLIGGFLDLKNEWPAADELD